MRDDFQGWNVPMGKIHSARGHIASAATLGLEHVAAIAPEVSFIHDFPGFVRSNIGRGPGWHMFMLRTMFIFMAPVIAIDTRESGERHVYELTSGSFPAAAEGKAKLGSAGNDPEPSIGSDGENGSGVYIVDQNAESGSRQVIDLLKGLRQENGIEWVWKQTEDEFVRITGVASI